MGNITGLGSNQYQNQYLANVQLDLSIAAYTKVPLSWHDYDYTPNFNKMYYIMEGEGYLKIGSQEYSPKPGELYILPAGVLQSYGTVSENTLGKYWCHFTSKLVDLQLFDLVNPSSYVVTVKDAKEMKGHFERLIDYAHRDDLTSGLRIRSILLEIISTFIELCDHTRFNMKTSSTFDKMSAVLQYIEDNASHHMTVEELAAIAHFQPNYFIHVFKNFTGLSPIQYINKHRLEKAVHLLTFTNLSISSIADSIGLELAYFSRMFKEHSGYAPSTYRELMLNPQTK
ncbi:AraC family transcriptional regulator [Paenibacillus sedimenti]|uniref:Helix-turn-helix transcriptional regulator n=1 Tax=Paenibacillus sedimenti TaxID=2770274 RepID=A0A926KPT4_9BACL|nr:AraC family transcriptional regulator [Paenibacillus sedimenti]MBD0380108.1 helix-turn-helix transcriptional regulator [Paenibacillus sedimenti]